MQTRVGLLVSDVMPIYIIVPRYSHNYACSTVMCSPIVKIFMLLREATSETNGPRVYSHHINLQSLYICFAFYLCLLFYLASLYQKYQKYYLSSLLDLTLVSDREGIDNP